ncbi:tyrosine-type recombinase/integrase [Lactobacillus apis]|uniref:tyrosine-type recombinase/integrase n=1 Tax=Lactobacillus apis TaxID=303541 RepID=UPI00242D6CF8|nr:site-specific integrase [Lactobacillus apis]
MVKFFSPQVTKTSNGKYQYSIRYRDPSFDGIRKKSLVIKNNSSYAKNHADLIVKQKIRASLGLSEQQPITFSSLSQKYFGTLEKRGNAYKTRLSYRSHLNKINEVFGKQMVSTITTIQINKFLDNLLYEKNLSNKTVHSYRALLNNVFSYAKQFGYIKTNPMVDVKINYKDESHKNNYRAENWYLTDDEMDKIIRDCNEMHRPDYRDFILWLYLTGMRIGEGGAIQVDDIIQKDDIFFCKINGTLIKIVGQGYVKQPFTKTKSSMRDIALPQQAVDLYLDNKKGKNKKDYLFTNKRTGNPFSTGTINPVLKSICKRQNIDKPITAHIFRHTHVSKLSELGYPLDVISKRVGHENDKITREIYLHITNRKAKKYNEMISGLNFPK